MEPALTLPRHLHRAILRLLRAAESAVRRLVIVMARGLTLPPPRRREATPGPAFLDKPGGTGLYAPQSAGVSGFLPLVPGRGGRSATRAFALPLLEPLRPFRPHRPPSSGMPRICAPGVIAPAPLRPPPAPDDPLDATRLALRLRALGAALDDLPGQVRRFVRWRARREEGRTRRIWPLRPGRPPGQRPQRRRGDAVYEILERLQGLAFHVLEHPDTS